MSLDKCFKGKSVLVTGAGNGIGRAISQRLHSYGATVYALSRSKEPLDSLVKECPNIIPITLDIGKSWDETRKVVDGLKNLDVVINNAAIIESSNKPFLEVNESDYDGLFAVNLKAIANISQIAAKNMIAAKKNGTITNISSNLALRAMDKMSMYCTSKAGLDMLTKCMALELGKHSIRVNALNLGMVRTNAFDKMAVKLGEEHLKKMFTSQMAKVVYGEDFLPMDDVVNTILFTSSDLSCTLTGSCIVLDGGYILS